MKACKRRWIVGSRFGRRVIACMALALIAGNSVIVAAGEQPRSELIRNVMIVDGSGEPAYRGDLRILGGDIASIGTFEPRAGEIETDGSGLTLAPGFIDTHSHLPESFRRSREAVAAISQGITTVVGGNDGESTFTMQGLARLMEDKPVAVNVASYTGHGTIRSSVMAGDFKKEASPSELKRMQGLLADELDGGSLGLSTGLEYDPGIYSSTDELIALAKVAAARGGRYISHMRSEDRSFDVALEELLRIGREAKLPVQVSHIKLASSDLWGDAGRVIARLDRARAEGIAVTADIYPYTYWHSTLTVLMPERDFEDLDAARYALEKLAPAEGLTLTHYAPNPAYAGKTVAEIAKLEGKSDEEAYLGLIKAAYADPSASVSGSPESVIGVSMTEDDIKALISWPYTNICSDGGDEPGAGHPRDYGAFPRAIRQYVREAEVLALEQMVHRMTGLSASNMGFVDRGLLKPGYVADLVLFDAALIGDKATVANPKNLSEGVVGVWVNGQRVWERGRATGRYPGRLLERSKLSGSKDR